jgi:hypothetical protein
MMSLLPQLWAPDRPRASQGAREPNCDRCRMNRRAIVIAVALMALIASADRQAWAAATEQTLQVAPLPRDGEVLISFKLGEALTDDIRNAIHSGLTVSFVYKVDLKRNSAVWIDRTIASAVVTATVRYDNLTRRYHVTRLIDGLTDGAEKLDREEAAWAWLTASFDRMSLFSRVPLEPNGDYYVRVRAHTTPRNAGFIWPWQGDDFVGFAKFTFIR